MSFEEHYRQLEEILTRLERGELSLDESLQDYERGVAALRTCHKILGEAEKRLEELDLEAQAPAEAP